MYKVATVLLVSLLARLCWCQCLNEFLHEPSTVSGSPISCNILGARVVMECAVATSSPSSIDVGWYFTTDMSQAGIVASSNQIDNDDMRFSITTTASTSDFVNNLAIVSYDNSHEGFYWCGLTQVESPVRGATFNPSRIVDLQAPFTTAQLPTCGGTVMLTRAGQRCAYGDREVMSPLIVPAAQFTNIATTTTEMPTVTTQAPTTPPTTAAPTTAAPTTAAPTTPTTITEEITTTAVVEEPAPTNSVVRTAVIWFSVGAAVFVLIIFAIILCVVAWIKC